jgi:hypothetical protein
MLLTGDIRSITFKSRVLEYPMSKLAGRNPAKQPAGEDYEVDEVAETVPSQCSK